MEIPWCVICPHLHPPPPSCVALLPQAAVADADGVDDVDTDVGDVDNVDDVDRMRARVDPVHFL